MVFKEKTSRPFCKCSLNRTKQSDLPRWLKKSSQAMVEIHATTKIVWLHLILTEGYQKHSDLTAPGYH